MITRWDKWFSDDNLAADRRILLAPHSQCAEYAAAGFLTRGKQRILDLACGVGRDTFYLESRGLAVIGTDASFNGLRAARRVRLERSAISELVAADARHLPFRDGSFEGVYCFGLLHEFAGERKEVDVREVMGEIKRLLCHEGILVLATLAGEPVAGLPAFRTRQMFKEETKGLHAIEIGIYDDIGCTCVADYRVWRGSFVR